MTGVFERVPQPDAVRVAVAQRLRHGLARAASMQDAGDTAEALTHLRHTVWKGIADLDPIEYGYLAAGLIDYLTDQLTNDELDVDDD